MKYYERMLRMGCFTWDDVLAMAGNPNTASSMVQEYLKKGYIRKVRRGQYAALNLADGSVASSPYLIATKATPSAYVAYHAAFAYYGCANQVSHRVEVASQTRFTPFVFDGMGYVCYSPPIKEGVVQFADGVRVTDIERTVVDGLNGFEKTMGLEEFLRCLLLVPAVREERLLACLCAYGKRTLYQKAGYVLEYYRDALRLSDTFFTTCRERVGNNSCYLQQTMRGMEGQAFNKTWRIVAPLDLMTLLSNGGDADAEI